MITEEFANIPGLDMPTLQEITINWGKLLVF